MNDLAIMTAFILGCWLTFILYWIVSAGSVKPIQRTTGWLNGNWYRLLLILGFLFMTNFRFLRRFDLPIVPFTTLLVPPSMLVTLLTIALMLGGLVIAIVARRTLAANWSGQVAIKEGHELITTGLYRHVRHPIYSGILLMTLGSALFFCTLSSLIGFVIVVLAMYLKRSAEERILDAHFGSEYLSYRQHSKALIPFLW